MKKIRNFGTCMAVGLMFLTAPAFAATADYTHFWSFDDGAGRSVADTGGQNGSIVGSSTGLGWAGGKIGTALGMDGSTGEGVALPSGFLSGSQGTLSVWFRIESLSDQNVLFSGKSTSDNNVYVLLSIDHEGRPQLQFRTDATGNDRKAQGMTILNRNEWYNLVLTADTVSYKMYVNGESVGIAGENMGRWFPDFTNQTLSYRIGMSEANPLVGSFNGTIDELRTYDRPLSPDEVTALYEEGNAGRPTVPLALRPTTTPAVAVENAVPVTTVTIGTNDGQKTESISGPSMEVTPMLVLSFMRDLNIGARGDDVKELQLMLIKQGFLSDGLSSGYFGQLTKDAVIKFQSKNGLPATGFFGPMTRAHIKTIEDMRATLGSASENTASLTPSVTTTEGIATKSDVEAKTKELLDLVAQLQKKLAALRASAAQ